MQCMFIGKVVIPKPNPSKLIGINICFSIRGMELVKKAAMKAPVIKIGFSQVTFQTCPWGECQRIRLIFLSSFVSVQLSPEKTAKHMQQNANMTTLNYFFPKNVPGTSNQALFLFFPFFKKKTKNLFLFPPPPKKKGLLLPKNVPSTS